MGVPKEISCRIVDAGCVPPPRPRQLLCKDFYGATVVILYTTSSVPSCSPVYVESTKVSDNIWVWCALLLPYVNKCVYIDIVYIYTSVGFMDVDDIFRCVQSVYVSGCVGPGLCRIRFFTVLALGL